MEQHIVHPLEAKAEGGQCGDCHVSFRQRSQSSYSAVAQSPLIITRAADG